MCVATCVRPWPLRASVGYLIDSHFSRSCCTQGSHVVDVWCIYQVPQVFSDVSSAAWVMRRGPEELPSQWYINSRTRRVYLFRVEGKHWACRIWTLPFAGELLVGNNLCLKEFFWWEILRFWETFLFGDTLRVWKTLLLCETCWRRSWEKGLDCIR